MVDRMHILNLVTCPCRDNGRKITDDTKLVRIDNYLESTNSSYSLIEKGRLFRLYGRKDLSDLSNIVVISAHADIVDSIKNPRCEEIKELLVGTFDNSAGDACALTLMAEEYLPDNVVIAFTMNEEHGMKGAFEVCKRFENNGLTFSSVVLDVTNIGFREKSDFTIENASWSEDFGSIVIDAAEGLGNYLFVPRERVPVDKTKYSYVPSERFCGFGWPDEAWAYAQNGIQTCSICVPTIGEMHDDSGLMMLKSSYMNYIKAVGMIASSLAKDLERRIDNGFLGKA